jgi:hypothetical protein
MSHRVSADSKEIQDTLRALRRAAKNALQLGLKTGTPVWVIKNNKLVDLTKEHRASKKSPAKRLSRKTDSRKAPASKTSR